MNQSHVIPGGSVFHVDDLPSGGSLLVCGVCGRDIELPLSVRGGTLYHEAGCDLLPIVKAPSKPVYLAIGSRLLSIAHAAEIVA